MIVTPVTYLNYPATLPKPRWTSYSANIDYGVYRADSVDGFPSQGRKYTNNPTRFSVEFLLSFAEFQSWVTFMEAQVSNRWFKIDIPTQNSDTQPAPNSNSIVRLSSSYETKHLGANTILLYCTLELMPTDIGKEMEPNQPPPTPPSPPDITEDWIIAGTPAAPSPEWVIAGTPNAPSPEWVLAGKPADHK